MWLLGQASQRHANDLHYTAIDMRRMRAAVETIALDIGDEGRDAAEAATATGPRYRAFAAFRVKGSRIL